MWKRFVLLGVLVVCAGSCGREPGGASRSAGEGDVPVVYVTLLPQAGLARRMMGEAARVEVLVAPGDNPHNFQPTVRQVAELSVARLWLALGTPFEEVLVERLRAAAPGLRIVDTAQGVPRLRYGETIVEMGEEGDAHDHGEEPAHGEEHEHGHDHGHDHGEEHGEHCHADEHGEAAEDEHLWLSPRRMRMVVKQMAETLAEAFPEAAEGIRQRAGEIDAEILAVDRELAGVFYAMQGQTVLVYHGAFGYLLHDYGLRQAAVEFGGKEPSPARIERLVRLMREKEIGVVFVQKQYPVESARVLAAGTGAVLVPLDDLPEDLIGGWRTMAQALRDGRSSPPAAHE